MKTLFKRANVLSMRSEEISYFNDVLVENGKITETGKDLLINDARIIDCSGKFLMPSLFDAHAHLTTSEMSELFIANGITSIRHLSGGARVMELDKKIRNKEAIGPYLYASGPIYDGAGAQEKPESHQYIDSLEDAEKAVYDTIQDRYLWVKTYPSIEPEHLKRLMETANSCGIKVCGHMSYLVDAKTLRDWGYHCCEHSSSLPRHSADIEYLAKSGMWFCPTQVVCETLPDYVWNGKKLSDLEHYEYVPQVVKDFWEEKNQSIIEGYKKRDLRPDINVIINRGRKFLEFSDRYLAGSDTLYPGMIAGFSLHEELYKLVSLYGCSNYESLKAATVNPAVYMGLQDQKGKIKKGMDADLLLLNKNPLADIRHTQTIEAVMQDGKLFERTDLDDMLAKVRHMKDEEVEFLAPIF